MSSDLTPDDKRERTQQNADEREVAAKDEASRTNVELRATIARLERNLEAIFNAARVSACAADLVVDACADAEESPDAK